MMYVGMGALYPIARAGAVNEALQAAECRATNGCHSRPSGGGER
jgi:hypothetical protein